MSWKKELAEKIETAKYRIHTTSPSYPILASLDAAQAMMSVKGEILATHTRELVHEFIMGVSDIAGLVKNQFAGGIQYTLAYSV